MSTNKTNKEYEVIKVDLFDLERDKLKVYFIITLFVMSDILLIAFVFLLIYHK